MDESVRIPQDPNAAKRAGHRTAYTRVSTDSQLGHRMRVPTEVLDNSEKMSPFMATPPSVGVPVDGSGKLGHFLARLVPADFQLSRQQFSYARLLFLSYCSLSCVIFTLTLLRRLYGIAPSFPVSDIMRAYNVTLALSMN